MQITLTHGLLRYPAKLPPAIHRRQQIRKIRKFQEICAWLRRVGKWKNFAEMTYQWPLSHRCVTFRAFSLNFKVILVVSSKKHSHFRDLRQILYQIPCLTFSLRPLIVQQGGLFFTSVLNKDKALGLLSRGTNKEWTSRAALLPTNRHTHGIRGGAVE